MTSATHHPPVHRLDLRGLDTAGCAAAAKEALARRNQVTRRWLVIVETDQLRVLDDVLMSLLGVQNMGGLIAVAIGPTHDRDRGIAVNRSTLLTGRKVLTIWVSDPAGIPWSMGGHVEETTDPGTSGLDELIAALAIRDVFDHVIDSAWAVPYQVISPGVRVKLGMISSAILAATHENVIKAVQGNDAAGPGTSLPLGEDRPLVGLLPEVPNPIRTASPLGLARRAAETTVTAFESSVAALPSLRSLANTGSGQQAWNALVTARRAVTGNVALVQRTLAEHDSRQQHDGSTLLDESPSLDKRGLTEEGIDFATPPHLGEEQVTRRTRALVGKALPTMSLRALADLLRQVRDRAALQGTQEYQHQIAAMNPERYASDPPACPIAPSPVRLGLSVILCCLVAAFGTGVFGLVAAGAAIALWLILACLVVHNRPVAAAARWNGMAVFTVMVLVACAAAGTVGGIMLARELSVPSAVSGVGVVLGLCALVAVARWWRQVASRTWAAQSDIAGMRRLTASVDLALRRAATLEWVYAVQRQHYSHLTGAVAALCSGLADACADYAGRHNQKQAAHAPNAQSGSKLYRRIHEDVLDGALTVLDGMWPQVSAESANTVRATAKTQFSQLLETHRDHLLMHNVHRPPPFARPGRPESGADILQVWSTDGTIDSTLAATAQSLMPQLCEEDDLVYLNQDAAQAVVLRFAPSGARAAVRHPELLADSAAGHPVVWTDGGFTTGVLRLVPVQSMAVEAT